MLHTYVSNIGSSVKGQCTQSSAIRFKWCSNTLSEKKFSVGRFGRFALAAMEGSAFFLFESASPGRKPIRVESSQTQASQAAHRRCTSGDVN